MTGAEVVAVATVVEEAVELIAKVVGVIQALQKGDLSPDEARAKLAEHSSAYSQARDEARAYVDTLFDNGDETKP